MFQKLALSALGLALGIAVSLLPRTSLAFDSPGLFLTCQDDCQLRYHLCVAERGARAGCGRERRSCLESCE
ncbi:MAG: hypothetical protein AMXMBFR25_03030 [Lysobacterales bacterium]|nr:hypothetical protein [Xanthomonadales bacterium]